jgi:tripeptide aminopeptidase
MEDLVRLFKNLAQIDSVSSEEKSVSDYILNFLKDLRLTPIQDGNNMIYCRIGDQPHPILLNGHIDTVEPGRDIQVLEKDGFLVSNGSTIIGADNKVNVAAILFTIKKLITENKDLNVELLFSVREETDSGIQQFDSKRIESKVGFVWDGGKGSLSWFAKKAPTLEDFKIEIIGKSSHASRPEQGINALNVLLELKDKITLGSPDEFSTLNIGLINGGSATNTVPERIKLEGDLRSTEITSFQKIKKDFEIALTESAEKFNARVNIKWLPYAYGYELDLTSKNAQRLLEIYKSQGIELNSEETRSGSDAGFLNHIGIETFCLGDGVFDTHAVTERINIETFYKLQSIIENIMLNFQND